MRSNLLAELERLGYTGIEPDDEAAYPAFWEPCAVSRWIGDKCQRKRSAWTAFGALFASWSAWAATAGAPPQSRWSFKKNLTAHRFASRRIHGGERGYAGIRLKEPA